MLHPNDLFGQFDHLVMHFHRFQNLTHGVSNAVRCLYPVDPFAKIGNRDDLIQTPPPLGRVRCDM